MMTKYDILHDKLMRKVDAGLISESKAVEMDNIIYNKYSDVEVTEAEVAEYLDDEMGKSYSTDGFNSDVATKDANTKADASDKSDLPEVNDNVEQMDDEMGKPVSTDGFNADVATTDANTAANPADKSNLPEVNDKVEQMDDEMGKSYAECVAAIDKMLAEVSDVTYEETDELIETQNKVFKAFESGCIDVDTALNYLDALDVTNYEFE